MRIEGFKYRDKLKQSTKLFALQIIVSYLLLAATSLKAQQTYPIYVTPSLTPPYSLTLSDYSQIGSQRLVVTIMVRDVTVTNLPVRLIIRMETTNGVTIETIPTAPIMPIYLTDGEGLVLFGDDLKDYFNINNLQFKGYSKEEYRRTGQLPEGFYRVTVEVHHFATGRLISNRGVAIAWMALGKPPILKTPDNKAEMGQIAGMPMTFSWLPSNVGVPNNGIQYTFDMWEMRVPGIDPNVIAASMPVFYSTTQMNTSLVVQPAMLMLEPGMNYAWRVTASDVMGQVQFAQGGRSEVRTFVYQCRCDSVTGFNVERRGQDVTYRWTPSINNTSFNIEMQNPVSGWSKSERIYDTKYEFKSDTEKTYRARVQAVCQGNEMNPSDFTSWRTVTIPGPLPAPDGCECGKEFPDRPLTNFTLRTDLQPGDTLENSNGDTRYIIKTVNKQSNDTYKGLFWFWWEYYRVKILCEYWDLQVNTDNRIIKYNFKSVYDPKFFVNVDSIKVFIDNLTNAIAGLLPQPQPETIELDFTIPDNPEYYYDTQTGTITIVDEAGNTHEIELPKDNDGKAILPTTLEDASGDKYMIDEKGNTTKVDNSINASTTRKLPLYVGVARNEGLWLASAFYTCNYNNIDRFEEILGKVKERNMQLYSAYKNEASCEVIVEYQITSIDWYNVRENDLKVMDVTRYLIDQGDEFHTYLNEEEIEFPIKKEQLKSGNNICKLVVKNTTKKTEKTVAEFSLIPKEETYPMMEVRRSISGNPNRKDAYLSNTDIPKSGEEFIYPDETLRFQIKDVVTEKQDTIQASDSKTRWYIDNEENTRYTGAEFSYTVPVRSETIKAILERNEKIDTVTITINPTIPVINGHIRLDYSAVALNKQDTINSRKYFNVAVPKCDTLKVGEFMKAAPKEIVVKTNRTAVNLNNEITQGDVDAGAKITDAYNYLAIMIDGHTDIDADGTIKNTVKLVSKLNYDNTNSLKESIKQGKANQFTEGILVKIERVSKENANQIRNMINQQDTTQYNFLNSVYYEIREGDPLNEWITFHNGSTIDVNINLTELGNTDPQTPTPQADFTRILAHELLHHWWTHFEPFNKLKWIVIQDKESEIVSKGYRISDGSIPNSKPKRRSSDTKDSNQGCSIGSGHERYNPENKDVCDKQYDYK